MEGKMEKNAFILIKKNKKVIGEGKLTSLRVVKEVVDVVENGSECGIGCDSFFDWETGQIIEAYTVVKKRLTLEEAHAPSALDLDHLSISDDM